jgi:hypothetical protein
MIVERLTPDQQKRLIELKALAVEHFDAGDWSDLGLLTGCVHEVQDHPRLLRSLSFNDPDYSTCATQMFMTMTRKDAKNFKIIEDFVTDKSGGGLTISTTDGGKRVYFTPSIFAVPDEPVDHRLVAVMMPFDRSFADVYDAIRMACQGAEMYAQRVDDIWENSTIIQDVFSLIWRASVVVCDFSGRNPNVFYECGIAHTLGKAVVPIAQHQSDVPFDVRHHRYLAYHPNAEGLAGLQTKLQTRLMTLGGTGAVGFTMS